MVMGLEQLTTAGASDAGQTQMSGERPLRVLMVTPRYFPLTGGVESHVYEVSRRMAALGTAVTILTTDRTGRLPAQEIHDGVEVRRVRAWPAQADYYFAPDLLRHI